MTWLDTESLLLHVWLGHSATTRSFIPTKQPQLRIAFRTDSINASSSLNNRSTWSLFFISSTCRSCSEDRTLSMRCMSCISSRCDSRNWSLARCQVCFSWLCCCRSNSSRWTTGRQTTIANQLPMYREWDIKPILVHMCKWHLIITYDDETQSNASNLTANIRFGLSLLPYK